MARFSSNIRRTSLTVWIILAGIFILTNESSAVVIKQANNYQLHFKVNNFNSPSPFISNYNKPPRKNPGYPSAVRTGNLTDNILLDSSRINPANYLGFKNSPSLHTANSISRNRLSANEMGTSLLENKGKRGLADLSVGSFLDDFKKDPTNEKIYFTSKDLIFSYKNKMNGILQLDMDMELNETDRLRQYEQNKLREREGRISGNLHNKANLKAYSVVNILSNFSILTFFIFSALILAIYVFFRFFMNKYI